LVKYLLTLVKAISKFFRKDDVEESEKFSEIIDERETILPLPQESIQQNLEDAMQIEEVEPTEKAFEAKPTELKEIKKEVEYKTPTDTSKTETTTQVQVDVNSLLTYLTELRDILYSLHNKLKAFKKV